MHGQLVLPIDAAAAHLPERPFATLLWPATTEAGDFVELQSLGDVIGDQILMTARAAWYQPRAELIFAG